MEGRERLHASDLETPVTHRLSHCRRAGLDFTFLSLSAGTMSVSFVFLMAEQIITNQI